MSRVIALIPAKYRSTGIPGKNWRPLVGIAPAFRATIVAHASGVDVVAVSCEGDTAPWNVLDPTGRQRWIQRPAALAQDDTPMLAVVEHALAQIPGEPDDAIVLLQPTQPLREPKHVTAAIELLRKRECDSVVSVVEVPLAYSPDVLCQIQNSGLVPFGDGFLFEQPTRRQEARQAYRRDGTVYAFWRGTVARGKSIYGYRVKPLIIPASESCSLDTMDDWAEAERRLRANQQSEVVVAHV